MYFGVDGIGGCPSLTPPRTGVVEDTRVETSTVSMGLKSKEPPENEHVEKIKTYFYTCHVVSSPSFPYVI